MKYLFLLGIIVGSCNCFGRYSVGPFPDTSLGRTIINQVLSKDREGHNLIVFTAITKNEIQSLMSRKPDLLWEYIRKVYGISDDIGISNILSEHSLNRLLFKVKTKTITLINTTGNEKMTAVLHEAKQPLRPTIADLVIVLYKKSEEKCLVYYHILNEGFSLALLERKSKFWNITDFKVETIE